MGTDRFDLSFLIPALNEAGNIGPLLCGVKDFLRRRGLRGQMLVIDGGSADGTREAAAREGAEVVIQRERGFGGALREGFGAARAPYILTLDADLSHPASFIEDLWNARGEGDVVVASRYVPGARFEAPILRKILSRILNAVFSRFLSLPIRDLSSNFRLYRAGVVRDLPLRGVHFEVLEEAIIKIHMSGWRVREIPFHYAPRRSGRSKAHFISFGICFLKTFLKMWAMRSSVASADYDHRAYDSRVPLQRYWQRRRHRIVLDWAGGWKGRVLDAGCGSSRILPDLPGAVGMDVAMNKLRFMRRFAPRLVRASVFSLPFLDGAFDGLVCSQVLEHVPSGDGPFRELARVLKPGGMAVIGTPDYGRPWWPAIEWFYARLHPNGYADEHITHYTLPSLSAHLASAGLECLESRYIFGAELIVLARKRTLP